eukprot:TRINITY_DN51340_c0_g1_i3.p1 TRINITY_DN51340_c0_g1~~TRINITY_DN51340_c0_g1_i3.p1  ORF type:complete len:312 (+),score=106.43 TRINITY_DN51340_c0_g1_i3:462-1397(+)
MAWAGAAPASKPIKKRSAGKQSILVIFDMNGVLVWRPVNGDLGINRPHLKNLKKVLWEHYPRITVAVWSSMKQKNLMPLVWQAFGSKTEDLVFVWDQDYCTDKGKKWSEKHGKVKPLLRKDLIKLADTEFADYAPDDVLLIDDDPVKCKKNPKGTAIHPATFEGDEEHDDELLYMAQYLDKLANSDCATVPDFVRKNPYLSPLQAKEAATKSKDEEAVEEEEDDDDANLVEVWMADLNDWMPYSAASVEEMPDGKLLLKSADGEEMRLPASWVRDLDESKKKEQAAAARAAAKSQAEDIRARGDRVCAKGC